MKRAYTNGILLDGTKQMQPEAHKILLTEDDKIIAIPLSDPTYNSYTSIDELPSHIFEEMVHFFKVYKELEHKTTAVDEIQDAEVAKEIIAHDIDQYIEKFCK